MEPRKRWRWSADWIWVGVPRRKKPRLPRLGESRSIAHHCLPWASLSFLSEVIDPRSFCVTPLAFLAVLLSQSHAQERPLRTAAEVQRLSLEEARQSREVLLRGVVTFTWHTGTTDFTIEDDTGAIWCPAISLPFDCRVGTEVEIEGRTDAGILGPFVHAAIVRRVATRILPVSRPSTFEELFATPLNARRVEIVGIVRGQRMNPDLGLDWLALDVATGGGRITVNVTHEATGHPELIEAMVRIRGVNLHETDPQQQAFLPMINAHSLADVEVLTAANPRPFDRPPTPLAGLMRSSSIAAAGHRVRARGMVTYVGRTDSFYLQDESRGIQVFLRESLLPVPGEAVDVVGFPEPGVFSPVLRDADWRPSAPVSPTAPVSTTLGEAIKHDGRLLSVRGRIAEIVPRDGEVLLTLDEDGQRGRVLVQNATPDQWKQGAVVRVTGVCSVEIGNWESFAARRRPTGFSLLAQSPDSVAVLQAAPWWNPFRVVWALGSAAVFACGALGFVWWRSRVRLREATRAHEAAHAQFVAVLAERNRIAREIHDTLAQGFTGISVQLEVMSDRLHNAPEGIRRHLDLARDLVRSSLHEARRSVWNLRAQALEEADLTGALQRLGQRFTSDQSVTFVFETKGTARTLPVDVENNLLRIGQEAVANAVRHAQAQHIALLLVFATNKVSLRVTDDGRGFEPAQVGPSAAGGFGLPGMRERAEAMHATLTISSKQGGGTHVELSVPHV